MLKRELEAEVRRQRRVIEELKDRNEWLENSRREDAEYHSDLQNEVGLLRVREKSVVTAISRCLKTDDQGNPYYESDLLAAMQRLEDVVTKLRGMADECLNGRAEIADLQNEVARLKGSTTDAVETVVAENERLRGELEHVRGEVERAKGESDDLDGQVREQEKRLAEHAKRIHAQRNEIDNYQRGAVEHHKQYNDAVHERDYARRLLQKSSKELGDTLLREQRLQAKLDAFVALAKSMEVDT
jgi:chromosome segregation ATPase